MRRRRLSLGWFLLAVPAGTWAQQPTSLADVLPRGQVVEHLTSRANAKATYALYLPSAYPGDRRWPIVFLLDPRGRARIPLDLFQRAAERLGFVLLSSYDSRSDGPREPNDVAMDAMLADAQRYLAVDTRRLYLAGFSGTARFAWDISEQFPGALAGILGFGAALPAEGPWLAEHVRGTRFGFFGAVGTNDPNYEEVRELERLLLSTSLAFRVDVFEGAHQWPPADVCARGLAFMAVQAMRRGLAPVDSALVDSLAHGSVAAAEERERAGDAPGAWRSWSRHVATFGALADSARAATRRDSLAREKSVVAFQRRESHLRALDLEWTRGLFAAMRELRTADATPSLGDVRGKAHVDDIRRAARSAESDMQVLARRATNRIQVYATFYELRDYFAQQRWERAATLLKLALTVAPDDDGVCYGLARAQAQLGDVDGALASLACATRGSLLSADAVEQAPLLAPLRGTPRFAAIVSELRGRSR